jgi:hypothetical protein
MSRLVCAVMLNLFQHSFSGRAEGLMEWTLKLVQGDR